MCARQSATALTDNCALLHCTFQQGSAVLPAVDVSAPTSTFNNLQHRSNSTLLNQQQHRLASRHSSPTARINVAQAIPFHHQKLQHSTTRLSFALLHIQASGLCYNLALLRGLTQQLSTISLVSLQNLLQHPPLSLEQISAPPPLSTTPSTRRHPTAPFGNAAPPTNSSSTIISHRCVSAARLSHHQKLHLFTYPPPILASALHP